MGAVQQPLYGAGLVGCNVGYAAPFYVYAQDLTSLDGFFAQPTQAQLEASQAYTNGRQLFLTECAARGMVTSECDFETMVVGNSATPVTCPAVGAFTSSFTTQFERFGAPGDTVPAATRSTNIRDMGVGTGRFNVTPTNATAPTGARWIEGAGNSVQFVLATPMTAIGFYFTDTNDTVPPIAPNGNHEPYKIVLETSAGQLIYDCTGTTNLNFFGAFMATGVTITSLRLRWQEYVNSPSQEDRTGIDGFILSRCP